jgi:hypothetical protein
MTRLVKLTMFASALALAGLGASSFALADKLPPPCIECLPGGGGGTPGVGNGQNDEGPGRHHPQVELPEGQSGPDQSGAPRRLHRPDSQQGLGDNAPDQGMPSRHGRKYHPDDQFQQGGNEDAGIYTKRTHHADRKWEYDPQRHERRRHKDNRFRFYFGGFWYPEPYWDEPYYYYDDYYDRVSCREGAEIVAERFARVRILDCDGRIYTYLGRRYGETFEIELSSRTGRILDAHEI